MHRRLARRVRLAPRAVIALFALAAAPARAQRVLGSGESADAFLVPRSVARVAIDQSFGGYSERFGAGGVRESLAAPYSAAEFGAATFPALRALDADVRALTGVSVSLGRLETRVNQLIKRTRLDVDAGVTSWLNVGVTFPFTFTRTDVSASLNATGARAGNVGRNPAYSSDADTRNGAVGRNQQVTSQLQAAAARLESRYTSCSAAPPAGGCDDFRRLATEALAYRAAIERSYGTSAFAGAGIVPRDSTPAQDSVLARLTRLSARVKTALGEPAETITARPAGAPDAPLTTRDLDSIAASGLLGVSGGSLGVIEHGHVGDMEVRVRARLFDSFGGSSERRLSPRGFNARAAVTGTFRFGTGSPDAPDELFDVGTGDGQNDVEVGVTADALFGSRAWTSVTARYTVQLSDNLPMRITDLPTDVFPEVFRRRVVDRDLGDVLYLEVAPRYSLSDYFGVGAYYAYRRKGADTYSGTFQLTAEQTGSGAVTLDAATLGLETAQQEHRVGWTVSYSTLRTATTRRSRLPLEVSFSHAQVVRGSGRVPRLSVDRAQLRVYTGLLGGRPRL